MESEELKGLKKKKKLQFWLKVKAKYGVFVVYGWGEFRVSMLTFYILFKELITDKLYKLIRWID